MRFTSDRAREHPRESLVDFVAYLDLYQEIGGDLDADAPAGVNVASAPSRTSAHTYAAVLRKE